MLAEKKEAQRRERRAKRLDRIFEDPSNGIILARNNGQVKQKISPQFEYFEPPPPSPKYVFYNLWYKPGDPARLYVRTGCLKRPISGKLGTILILNLSTGQIERARFAGWGEWAEIRGGLGLCKFEGHVEIEPGVLGAALGVAI